MTINHKLLFIDIDGTLFDHEKDGIPESAKEAILSAKSKGHKIFLSTGRPYADIDKEIRYAVDKEAGHLIRIIRYARHQSAGLPLREKADRELSHRIKHLTLHPADHLRRNPCRQRSLQDTYPLNQYLCQDHHNDKYAERQ